MQREIRCPVCWGNVEIDVVACGRCESPHHDDCFSFAGGCGVFGCGSQERTGYQPPPPGEVTVLQPAAEPPPRAAGLPRTLARRIGDSYSCLFRNWRLAAGIAAVHAAIVALAGFGLGLSPLDSDLGSYVQMRAPLVRAAIEERSRRVTLAPAVSPAKKIPELETEEPVPPASWPIEIAGATVLALDAFNVLGLFFMVVMIAGLMTRSRGKQLTQQELFGLAHTRFLRVVSTMVRVGLYITIPMLIAFGSGAFVVHAFGGLGWFVAPWVGIAAIIWGIYAGNLYSLAVTIAAVGPEEEPGDPLERSAELVRLSPLEIFLGFWVVGILQAIVVLFAGGTLGIAYGMMTVFMGDTGPFVGALEYGILVLISTLLLALPCYNVLLYLECRKARDAKDLPYFPADMTGAGS